MFLLNTAVLVLVIASNILCQQETFVCTNAYLNYFSWVQINHLLKKISKATDIMSPIGKRCWDDFGLIMFQNCDARSAGNNQFVIMDAPCEYNTTFYYVCGSKNQGLMLVLSEEREELLLAGNQSDIAQSKASAHRCLEEKFDMFGCVQTQFANVASCSTIRGFWCF
ncbi:hypothetical protein pipiens_002384 [Culex pipiens pipiens]|uniref:Uncharacterized protein n=1 Tax=Culex pipiens pipiens TaxID=38569 RepID=A0ABD1DFH8_CULPP